MGSFARKLQRNKLKAAIKKSGIKQTMPLSKYRFKTPEEIKAEQAEKITEQMLQTIKSDNHTK